MSPWANLISPCMRGLAPSHSVGSVLVGPSKAAHQHEIRGLLTLLSSFRFHIPCASVCWALYFAITSRNARKELNDIERFVDSVEEDEEDLEPNLDIRQPGQSLSKIDEFGSLDLTTFLFMDSLLVRERAFRRWRRTARTRIGKKDHHRSLPQSRRQSPDGPAIHSSRTLEPAEGMLSSAM